MTPIILVAVLGCLLALPIHATTLRQYTPGGAPCAGACGYEWARAKFDVPPGTPERMMIPVGSIVTQMSYAKQGKPYVIVDGAILAEDEPGQGYTFERDGQTYMMVQIDKCLNWAVMIPPPAGLAGVAAADYASRPIAELYGSSVFSPTTSGGGFYGSSAYNAKTLGSEFYSAYRGFDAGGGGDSTAALDKPLAHDGVDAAVPLPASVRLILAALVAMILFATHRHSALPLSE